MIRLPRIPLPLLALAGLALAWGEAWLEVAWAAARIRSDPAAAIRLHIAAGQAAVRGRFQREAAEIDRIAQRLAAAKVVREGLARPEREGSRDLFDAVLEPAWAGVEGGGIEVIRAEGAVAAWNGVTPVPGGGLADPALTVRRLETGAIHVWYVETVPVRAGGKDGAVLGAVRVGAPVEARAGLHARFRRVRSLSDAALEVGVKGVRVRAGGIDAVAEDAGASAPLDPQDPALGGVIEIPGPTDEDLFAAAAQGARTRGRLLSAALVIAGCIALGRRCARRLEIRPALRLAFLTALPWGARYGLVLLSLPGPSTAIAMLDTGAYGITEFGGILSSPAEFLLTAATALASVAIFLRGTGPRPGALQEGGAGAIAGAGAWLLAVAADSVVRDSTLVFFDPAQPLPESAGLALHAGLFLLALAALLLVAGRWGTSARAALLGLGAAAGIALAASPLAPDGLSAGALVAVALLLAGGGWLGRTRTLPQRIVIFSLFAAAALHLCFSAGLDEVRRRRMIEKLPDALAPSDGSYLLFAEHAAEALAEADDVRTLVSLWNPSPPDPHLAVDLWRRTIAQFECDGFVAVRDGGGHVISSFAINFPPTSAWAADLADLPSEPKNWAVRLPGDARVDVYAAHWPVTDPDGNPSGSVLVAVSPPDRSLRSTSFPGAERPKKAERPLPPVRVRRFPDTAEGLPAAVAEHFRGSDAPFWLRPPEGEEDEETLWWREAKEKCVVAMSCPMPAALERGAAFLSLFLYDASFGLIGGLGVLVVGWLGRPRVAPAEARRAAARFLGRMEHRLLAYFLGVSLAPILVLSVFSRTLVSNRIEAEVSDDAVRSADLAAHFLAAERDEQVKRGVPADAAVPLEPFCRRFAALTGKDLSVYSPGRLGATSKPELYELGDQPRRVPARAYRALALEDQEAWLERWSIGGRQYRLGFRAVREGGRTARILAVPVLFNRSEVDQETGRATVLIFGSYGIVVLCLWLGALVLSERLTQPIRHLLDGTRRVAAGEVDFRILSEATGELQELVEAFNRMTAELRVGRDNLARAEREAAWREMARQIAHEIKNPLTPMKLSAQEIGRAFRDGDPEAAEIVASGVRTIVQQIDLLGRIATEFSTFARLPVGKRERAELNPLVLDAARLFERAEPPALHVACDVQEDLPAVEMDLDEMRRVLTNLCRNAIQAMPGGGTITLSTRKVLGEDGRLRARLRVSDTGEGIDPAVLPRVFEPYFSTRAEGTGLGLAICKRIVEDLGGTIAVFSRRGEGSTFTIELPGAPGA